jgi:chromosome segregation ATPase
MASSSLGLAPTPHESSSETKEGEEMSSSEGSSSVESDLDKNRARLAKLERIKRKLKDRDSRLSVLVKDNNKSIVEGAIKPYENHSPIEEQADSNEAVRVLSYAAFKLQRQVDKKNDEAQSLQRTVEKLEESLQEKEKEASTLTVDMNIFRKSLQAYSDQIERLAAELDAKNKAMVALIDQNDHQKVQVDEMKGRLAACREDYEWMRKESMSKSEQVEYFEYELLSKNDEIDKLHQEIDQKLKRIVELEVDMELMDARICRSPAEKEDDESKDRFVQLKEANAAAEHARHRTPQKRSAIFRLRDLQCKSKAEDTEAVRAMLRQSPSADETHNGGFPTDTSTEATTVLSRSTDASSSVRNRRATGKKNGKNTKDQQYIEIIDNLRSDLHAIEAKYKQEKYDSTKLIEKLKQENNEFLIKLVCLDSNARNKDDHSASLSALPDDINDGMGSFFEGSSMSGETPVDSKVNLLRAKSMLSSVSELPNKTEYLQKKIEYLEGERMVQQQTIDELTSKISGLDRLARHREKADKRKIDDLVFENEALAMKVSELQHGSRFSSRFLSGSQGSDDEYAAMLEERINDQSIDIERLELENDLKDRTIEALRSQLVDQRTRR